MEKQSILRTAFSFKGRMARRPFWTAFIINSLLFYGGIFVIATEGGSYSLLSNPAKIAQIPLLLLFIALFVNRLALISRRFHDAGQSLVLYFGLLMMGGLFGLVPVLGKIARFACVVGIIVILCKGTNHNNETCGQAPQKSESLDTANVEETEL